MGHIKLIQVGNIIEKYEFEKDYVHPRRSRSTKPRSRVPKRRYDNLQRLRKSFTRLIRCNLAGASRPFLLTLTMHQIVSLEQAYSHLTNFIVQIRRRYGKEFRYVGVPEFQKRGAVHFHILVWDLPHDVYLKEGSFGARKGNTLYRWYRFLQENNIPLERLGACRSLQHTWARGFLDCTPTDGSEKLSSYLAKYMLKASVDERLRGQKSYFSSRNALRPLLLTAPTQAQKDFAKEHGIDLVDTGDNQVIYKSSFDTMWLGRCIVTKYKLNTHAES